MIYDQPVGSREAYRNIGLWEMENENRNFKTNLKSLAITKKK